MLKIGWSIDELWVIKRRFLECKTMDYETGNDE